MSEERKSRWGVMIHAKSGNLIFEYTFDRLEEAEKFVEAVMGEMCRTDIKYHKVEYSVAPGLGCELFFPPGSVGWVRIIEVPT